MGISKSGNRRRRQGQTITDTSAIKQSVDLRTLVAETHPLVKNVRRCPFHNEKTASFRVHEHYYKCFGCGASGDAITWLRFLGLSFREAVAELEQRAGMTAPSKTVRTTTIHIEAAEWYNGLTRFYHLFLESYPENDHMRDLYESHRNAAPTDVFSAYQRVRTPFLAAQLRAAVREREELCQFLRSAI